MGKVTTYYVIEDDLIEKAKDLSFDLIEFINDELLQYHDYKDQEFWRCGIEYGTGVKAWHPTIELLKLLDNSDDKIIGQILDVDKFGGFDEPPYLIKSNDVKKVWSELKKISIDLIEKSITNKRIVDEIKNIEGYRMDSIENKPLILLEFIEIFKAFYQAQERNKGIAIEQS
ncbi:hypothetical protein [Mesoflavibacter profundi]|uniref:hypothetical protein n=1 Tax=Mesoflavibacter profundi TaxID=2708110 RepID=UPI0035120249